MLHISELIFSIMENVYYFYDLHTFVTQLFLMFALFDIENPKAYIILFSCWTFAYIQRLCFGIFCFISFNSFRFRRCKLKEL
jgi:hypothetical protein